MKSRVLELLILSIFLGFFLISCDDDEGSSTSSLQLNISGLEDLGSDYIYEGWLITSDGPVTSGTFTVNQDGDLSKTEFDIDQETIDGATAFVLTIEPNPDSDPAPSAVHILAGDFNGSDASLTIDHASALNTNFSGIMGEYIIATPTDGMNNNEKSGIWFLDNSSGTPEAGLVLPALPEGWVYEGWAVIDGTPVTTGTFTTAAGADNAAPFSGSMGGPSYPGEDFLNNAPGSLTFPTDLSGGTAVISVEPSPDNSPDPFTLKPLVGGIPVDAQDHVVYQMNQNLTFPTGTASK